MIICDTGPLVAALDRRDKHHAVAADFLDHFDGELLITPLIVAEVCYLADARLGAEFEAGFLDSIVRKELTVVTHTDSDWERMTQLVRQYADFPLGVADASVIALAERLNVMQVVTIDHRHFRAVRPLHCEALELLPHI